MFAYTFSFAQLSTHEQPVSFTKGLRLVVKKRSATPIATMPQLDMDAIEKEDKEDEEYDMPPRFGYTHFVDYNLNNSGVWYELPNGDKLWQLNVFCPNALSVNFCYDKFWLPEGSKLFIYSKDKKHSIGAFTSKNNKGDREDLRGFATGLVYGNDVILEYYQPRTVTTDAIISIKYVVHGYRYINFGTKGFGQSGSCMVDINCEEGQDWQNEKKAVALILVNGHRYCSGSLINTTDLSQKPYLLTADHCLGGWANGNYKYDAVTSPNIDFYSFYWNYEAPGCMSNSNLEPPIYSTSGATILANNFVSDFALLRLTEAPNNIPNFIPYYLGWDSSGQSGEPGTCIHHPNGDVKKISTVENAPTSTYWGNQTQYPNTFWKVYWKETINGHSTVVGGSSGSPLLNHSHRVIGQLRGGSCDGCSTPNGNSKYGRFDVSWTGYNNDSMQRRLNCWLDTINSGVQTMEGLLVIPEIRTMTTDLQLNSNILIKNTGQLTIQGEVELMGHCRVIVEAGGKLIIAGGTLSNVDLILQPGSSLRITNGGIIETRNSFDAPVGALVEILNGQIL